MPGDPHDPSLATTHSVIAPRQDVSTAPPATLPDAIAFTLPGARWPAGFIFLDDFEVEGTLGEGGMGVVYLVRQRSSEHRLAVKRARLMSPDSRRRFLAELQLWIGLPAHPHLAPCRFFRTVGDEVVIFTDHAAGGSLGDWIGQGKLTRVRDILDVSIQVAWGLHALHERGLVHQDVKPANVLMMADGLARVTDFGLARARARSRSPTPGRAESGQSVLVSGGAMTPAYCSPEQEQARPVSRRTDIWSWGVLLLEMFVGRVPCCEAGGPRAPQVLDRYLAGATPASGVEPMPAAVVEVLRLCFAADPAQRWASLAEAAEWLAEAYRELTGQPYPRSAPASEAADPELVPVNRASSWAGAWEPPRKWLTLAYQAAGRDPTEVETALPPPAASRRAQAVADLSVYDEARLLLEELIAQGRPDLEPRLAAVLVQKALVHTSVSDWAGAVSLFDRALSSWQQLVYGGYQPELKPFLVRSLLYKAAALRSMGDYSGTIALCDRVVLMWQKLDNHRARRDLSDDLAAAYLEKGLALRSMGKARHALVQFDHAITIWQELAEREGCAEASNDLARAFLCKASVLSGMGQPEEALPLCEEAVKIRRRLVQREGRRDLRGDLARALLHRGQVLRVSEMASSAVPLYDQAIALLEEAVHEEGRDDLNHELARALLARANAARGMGELRAAAELCARAAGLWEALVHQEGRRELTVDLARAYVQLAQILRLAGEPAQAVARCDQAIHLWERLVQTEGRTELTNDLARSYASKAVALQQMGQPGQALALYERAIELRRQLLTRTVRDDVPHDLARDRVGRAEVLLDLGRQEEAVAALAEAVGQLELLVEQAPRADLKKVLARARRRLQQLGEGGHEIPGG